MGLITWVIAVLALMLGGLALFLQISAPEPIDFQQCTIVNSGSGGSPTQTTCNQLCGEKTCLFGLISSSQNHIPTSDLNSHESLVSCTETTAYGTVQDENGFQGANIACVCCS